MSDDNRVTSIAALFFARAACDIAGDSENVERFTESIDAAIGGGHLYSVRTYDPQTEAYTPQDGLECPSTAVTILGVRRCLRELQSMGYPCDRDDASVFVERIT